MRNAFSGQPPCPVIAWHGLHAHRVDVRTLLAVDLDAHEPLVHQRRDLWVLERLVRHHVAPVAGRVADRDEQRTVLAHAPARAPPRPTGTSRPGCPCAGAGTASSRPRGDSARRPGYPCGRAGNTLPAHGIRANVDQRPRRPGRGRALRPRGPQPATCCSARGRSRSTRGPASWSAATAADQAGRCLENLAAVCHAAGATLGDAVRADRLHDRDGVVRARSTRCTSRSSSQTRRRGSRSAWRRCRAARRSRSTRWWRSLTDTIPDQAAHAEVTVADIRRAAQAGAGVVRQTPVLSSRDAERARGRDGRAEGREPPADRVVQAPRRAREARRARRPLRRRGGHRQRRQPRPGASRTPPARAASAARCSCPSRRRSPRSRPSIALGATVHLVGATIDEALRRRPRARRSASGSRSCTRSTTRT